MALATDLPIYRQAYELLMLVAKLTESYPRSYRAILARDIFAEAQGLVTLVFRANCVRDKVPAIEALRERLGVLQLQLRLSADLGLISPGQFGATVVLTESVGRQAAGWLSYSRGRA